MPTKSIATFATFATVATPKIAPKSPPIAILITGGTFDKTYNELNGELFFKKSHLQEMLTLGRSLLPVRAETLMMKDSLLMTDSDRALIGKACKTAKEKHIVITHGTDTMEETARYLAHALCTQEKKSAAKQVVAAATGKATHKATDKASQRARDNGFNKTIILTGAMVPYKFGSSDGLFNLGSALAYAQLLPPGVYVAMNGRWFEWDNVRKNKKIGYFEELKKADKTT